MLDSKIIFKIFVCFAVSIAFLLSCEKKEVELGTEELGEFAPSDAYLEGSEHPYYGSENEWNRRFFYEHIGRFYKRRGQRQMLDLVEGRPQETSKYCRELLKQDPNDLESLYNLAVALAHLDSMDEAIKTTKKALQKGLPIERFLAGPRDVLKPLTDSEPFKKIAKLYKIKLIHGPMLGRLTDISASFWVRTLTESQVEIIVSENENLKKSIRSNLFQTRTSDDYTTIAVVNDLKPATKYFYDVQVDNKSTFSSELPSFHTYPKLRAAANFSIAFGGGAGYVPENERIWEVIRNHQPSAFFGMGDNVYINMPESPNGVHYYTYYRRQSRPEFRRLTASTPIYAIWDDHDAATDDIWMGPYKDKPSWKMPQLDVFRQNWINPGYGDTEWPGCWFSFSIADVDFFMLDGRFYRTNPNDTNPTMLGPVQKDWLLQGLKNSKATFKVIASPVPWVLGTKGQAKDTWDGFRDERNEIFDYLSENKIDGVFLLSADRHRSDAWKIERENGYPLYEFESSRLTNQHFHPIIEGCIFGYNEKQSFGLVTFNTGEPEPTITFQVINIDDEIVHSLTIKQSEISHVK